MKKGIIWMVHNSVAANLLMLLLIAGGLIFGRGIRQEIFPEIELDEVSVQVAYPGAGPDEVESGVCLPVEEAIFAIEGVKELRCVANEGVGAVTAELVTGADVDVALQDIKAEVDRIQTFPEGAEDPIISKLIPRKEVISLAVYGDVSERTLREQAELIRDGLLDDSEITQVDLSGVRPYEISIELDESTLQKYGLTLDRIAERIRRASVDVPGGTVKTRGGDVLLRTREKRYTGDEYAQTSIITLPDGTEVLLGDIATIVDGFEETDQSGEFNGKPAAIIQIYRVGEQRPIEISQIVREFIEERESQLPPGIELRVWKDRSVMLNARLNLLKKNAYIGLTLVFLVLGLFMEWRLAFWVMLGIPISFLGALFVLPTTDVTINMISLFAFILSLGIVVDDAIIVGENIYEHRERKKGRLQAAIDGVLEVKTAVIFSVLTSMAAFMPMLFVSGMMGKFMRVIPTIVIAVLFVSLVESLLILPAHLAHSKKRAAAETDSFFVRLRKRCKHGLQRFIDGPYRKSVEWSLHNRYMTLASSFAILLVALGLLMGGVIRLVHMPRVDDESVTVTLEMPVGTPIEETTRYRSLLYAGAQEAIAHFQEQQGDEVPVARSRYSIVGSGMAARGHAPQSTSSGAHLAALRVILQPSDKREFTSHEFAKRWRDAVDEIPGAQALTFKSSLIRMGDDIDVQLEHADYRVLRTAADELKRQLRNIEGVSEVHDNFSEGKRELSLAILPAARTLGVTETDLGRQIRGAFYGSEALRLQRGREELKVMVRYPLEQRNSLGDVDSLRIRTPDGGEVPFAQVAQVQEGKGYSQIRRSKRKRVVNVSASVDKITANPKEIITKLSSSVLADLITQFPGLSYTLEGEERERRDSMSSLYQGFNFVMLLIYALLAIPFKSYIQPLIVMSAIPFGIVGAAIGHLVLGHDISLLSMCGLVALSGVVVNDSLLLVDYINRHRQEHDSLYAAVVEGGCRRFRQIVITSLTTFFGLAPIIFETDLQAQFLIPMAISLGFGVLFATLITLYLIPTLYMIAEDLRGLGRRNADPYEQDLQQVN